MTLATLDGCVQSSDLALHTISTRSDALHMLDNGEAVLLSMSGSGPTPEPESLPVVRGAESASAPPVAFLFPDELGDSDVAAGSDGVGVGVGIGVDIGIGSGSGSEVALGSGSGMGAGTAGASSARTRGIRERRGSSGGSVAAEDASARGCVGIDGRAGGNRRGQGGGLAAVAESVSGDLTVVLGLGLVGRGPCLGLLEFPDEILLHIFSYLDLPDLELLARLSPILAPLTTDPVLHLHRLRIVSPSRVSHGLFARGPQGQPLRPSVGDLVQRGVLKGLGIERAWRMGGYWGSARSKIQYENGRALARRLACNILATQLRRRAGGPSIRTPAASGAASTSEPRSVDSAAAASSLRALYVLQVYPDVEGSSPQIARALLPTMRKLKWCLQRDRLARVFKESGVSYGSVGAWLETPAGAERGWRVLVRERDEEKLRLAVCPDIRKARSVFEALAGVRKV